MHLICPHCQSPIELVSLPGTGEVVCGSCGSTFRVESGSTAPWDSEAGRRLGRFDLIAVVGSGAFGTVYRARDLQLDRVVALKVPRAGNLPEAPTSTGSSAKAGIPPGSCGTRQLWPYMRWARSMASLLLSATLSKA